MGPGRMLEALRSKYPGCLDLPSETEIRQRITALSAKYKKHGTLILKSRGIHEPFRSIIVAIVEESQFTMRPKAALDQFKERASTADYENDFPSDEKVKSFVSSLKSKRKQATG